MYQTKITKKSQTATEYMVIVAVVIVIALVVVQIMGGFPGLGGSTSKKVSDYQLSSGDKIGISNYYFGNGYALATLKSNHYDTLQVVNVTIRGISCATNNTNISGTNSSAFILTLNTGQSARINCTGEFNESYNNEATPSFSANYIDSIMGSSSTASYSANGLSGTGSGTGNISGENGSLETPVVCNDNLTFHNGTGTAGSPYGICNWAQLNNTRNYLSAYFILLSNLNSSSANYTGIGNNWQPIGSQPTPFTGNFNGNAKSISNLVMNKSGVDNIGLFGYLTGNINSLGLINFSAIGRNDVAGLVGKQDTGIISNSYSAGTATGASGVGGLVGYQPSGSIDNCYSTSNLNGVQYVGGLVGSSNGGSVTNSYSIGNVIGDSYVGGISGYLTGTIINSSSSGNVNSSGNNAGGLVGYQDGGLISNSSSTGTVLGSGDSVGGLVGNQNSGIISNSSSTGSVTGLSKDIGGLVGISKGTISKSFSTGSVTGTGIDVGGLVGISSSGTISESYSTGNVNSSGNNAGGLVGVLFGVPFGASISDSYSTGNVQGNSVVGGLVGFVYAASVSNSFSVGNVANVTGSGGLIGVHSSGGSVTNSFWDTQTSGMTISADGTGLITQNMKSWSAYQSAGWSISYSGTDLNDGYPYLGWQNGDLSNTWLIVPSPGG